jgi:hypothetical protein
VNYNDTFREKLGAYSLFPSLASSLFNGSDNGSQFSEHLQEQLKYIRAIRPIFAFLRNAHVLYTCNDWLLWIGAELVRDYANNYWAFEAMRMCLLLP